MTTPATPAADAVSQAEPLYCAAINCGHVIEKDYVTLRFDETKPGHNALNQLGRRLDAAATARESALVAERDALQADLQRLMDKHNVLHVNAHAVRVERDALRAAIEDAADEWARYVEVDTAPRTLTKHMLAAFDAALAAPAVEAPKPQKPMTLLESVQELDEIWLDGHGGD